MNQDELDRMNDIALERAESRWLEPDDEDYDIDDEAICIAEDEAMDERDGFND